MFQIKNTGTVSLKFGRGADSTDMGNGVGLNAGDVHEFTALELGVTGNKFLPACHRQECAESDRY